MVGGIQHLGVVAAEKGSRRPAPLSGKGQGFRLKIRVRKGWPQGEGKSLAMST